jgi:hypothetical protein
MRDCANFEPCIAHTSTDNKIVDWIVKENLSRRSNE